MKKLQLLLLLGMFIGSSQFIKAQVFAYPGATWVFKSDAFQFGFCFGGYYKWEYTGDTLILGVNANRITVNQEWTFPWDSTVYHSSSYESFFYVNGDTVSTLNTLNGAWQEMYNFSLQTGDTTFSPIRNFYCDTTYPQLYNFPAVVTNHGLDTVDGQVLRFYTLKYRTSTPNDDFSDTIYAYQTYYERFITMNYWSPTDWFSCNSTDVCSNPSLLCYKDNGMMTDSLCANLDWFEILSIPQEPQQIPPISIYPNPTTNVLTVQHDPNTTEKYSIIGSDGKLILTNIQSPINVSQLPSGVYFITNEARTWYKKFIKG